MSPGDPPPVRPAKRPELAALQIGDPPERWRALGFDVSQDGVLAVGGVELWLDSAGHGITGWTLRRVAQRGDIDGLSTGFTTDPPPAPVSHPNGAVGIDHVVVTTPEFERTASALSDAGLPLRRVSEAGDDQRPFRQGFRRLGEVVLELVQAPGLPAGPARFWGLVVVVADLPRLHAELSPLLSDIRDAVQPGRHIAALNDAAGIGPRLAFMDPQPD